MASPARFSSVSGPYLDDAPAFSSLGRQVWPWKPARCHAEVVSTSKTSGTCSFGKASREKAQRMAMCLALWRFEGLKGPWLRHSA